MPAPKVSIIIVNYNGAEDTNECLNSLKKIDYENYEVIVVDNASGDASFVLNKMHQDFSDVKILALPHNHGFAGGNNAGINHALGNGAEYMLLLNNDTVIARDFLTRMVEAAQSDECAAFVGAKIYFLNEPKRIWFNGADFSWISGGKHYQYGQIDPDPDETRLKNTGYVTGCALLARAKVIQDIGLLSEDFFMYYEDVDWSLRAQKAGYKTIVAPAAHIWHKVSRSAEKMGVPVIHYYHIRNALILTKKHAPFAVKMFVYAWSVTHYLKQTAKLMFRDLVSKHIARAIMEGIEDFYRGKYGKMNYDPRRH